MDVEERAKKKDDRGKRVEDKREVDTHAHIRAHARAYIYIAWLRLS